jgi:hypothetical protein
MEIFSILHVALLASNYIAWGFDNILILILEIFYSNWAIKLCKDNHLFDS